jgi:hypothetical protein
MTLSINRDRLRQALNVVFSITQVLAIYGTVAAGTGADLTTRSNAEPPVVPALYTFGIWSVIYLGSIVYAVYQALPAQLENALLRCIGFFSASAFLASTLWAIAAGFGWYWLTVVFIFLMLGSLLGAFIQFIRYRLPLTTAERLLVVPPISVFTGYITVATIANTASTLKMYGFSNVVLSDQNWAIVMLIAAGVIGSSVTLVSRGNVWYALTVIWALIGVLVANVVSVPNTAVAVVAGSAAGLVALALLRAQMVARASAPG